MNVIKLLPLLTTLFVGLAFAKAQTFPVSDCCSQLIEERKETKKLRTLLDTTRNVGDRIIAKTDARIATTVKDANAKITAATRAVEAAQKSEAAALVALASQKAETKQEEERADVAEKELKHWKPKTKAGIFFRKARNALAGIGGGTILFLIVKSTL